MPELPEVEVTKRGLAPAVVGKVFSAAIVRKEKLRDPIPDFERFLRARVLLGLERRAKYLIWTFGGANGEALGSKPVWLVTHMGMSGSWRIWREPFPDPKKHDHVDLIFESEAGKPCKERVMLRYTDPRRFGSMRIFEVDPKTVPPLSQLGFEPWDERLTPEVFHEELHRTSRSIKETLLSGSIVVGCGNIYCSEALFRAGIRPSRPSCSLSLQSAGKLLAAVKAVLEDAIAAGGSTLRDFHGAEGADGWFALSAQVYGREGEACVKCGGPVRRFEQGGRSTFWCPHCQH